MATHQELTAEIDALQARRDTLQADADKALDELETARLHLIDGRPKAPEQVTAGQSRHAALTGALGSIDARLGKMRAAAATAQAAEAHAARMVRLVELAATATRHRADTEQAAAKLDAALQPAVAELVGIQGQAAGACNEFLSLVRQVAGDAVDSPAALQVLADLQDAGTDLAAVLACHPGRLPTNIDTAPARLEGLRFGSFITDMLHDEQVRLTRAATVADTGVMWSPSMSGLRPDLMQGDLVLLQSTAAAPVEEAPVIGTLEAEALAAAAVRESLRTEQAA